MNDGVVGNVTTQIKMDSAGGSASMARDRNTQAIYALKGKPLTISGEIA